MRTCQSLEKALLDELLVLALVQLSFHLVLALRRPTLQLLEWAAYLLRSLHHRHGPH
jgi:hypothetical protein